MHQLLSDFGMSSVLPAGLVLLAVWIWNLYRLERQEQERTAIRRRLTGRG